MRRALGAFLIIDVLVAMACSDADAPDAGSLDGGGSDASRSTDLLDAGTGASDADASRVPDEDASDSGRGHDSGAPDPRDDEFDSAGTLAGWSEYNAFKHASLDIGSTLAGFLTVVPTATSFNGWYSEYEGHLFYKTATGNFVVETLVTLGTATSRTTTPTLQDSYAQAGFVVRDPASTVHAQRWIMYNLGYQDSAVAREIKTTVPSGDGISDSLSTLHLNNTAGGANAGRLRVCRIGSDFRFFHLHPGEADWIEETYRSTGPAPTRVLGNGPKPPRTDDSPLSFSRPDMPATVQVGLYVGNYAPPPGGTRGDFDYIRFGSVAAAADCTRPLR